jgi:hypothetical protein
MVEVVGEVVGEVGEGGARVAERGRGRVAVVGVAWGVVWQALVVGACMPGVTYVRCQDKHFIKHTKLKQCFCICLACHAAVMWLRNHACSQQPGPSAADAFRAYCSTWPPPCPAASMQGRAGPNGAAAVLLPRT